MRRVLFSRVAKLLLIGLASVLSLPLTATLALNAVAEEPDCTPSLYTTSSEPWAQSVPLISPEEVAQQVSAAGLNKGSFNLVTRGTVLADFSFPSDGSASDLKMSLNYEDNSKPVTVDGTLVIAVPDSAIKNSKGHWDYTISTNWPYRNYGRSSYVGPQEQGVINLGHNFADFSFDDVKNRTTYEILDIISQPAGAKVLTSQPYSDVTNYRTLPFGVQFDRPGIYYAEYGTEFDTFSGQHARVTQPIVFAVGSEVVNYLSALRGDNSVLFPERELHWFECPVIGPANPAKPDVPEVPVKPDTPKDPVKPQPPSQPDTPVQPAIPAQPGNDSSTGGGSQPSTQADDTSSSSTAPVISAGPQQPGFQQHVVPDSKSAESRGSAKFTQQTVDESARPGLISPNRVTAAPGVSVTSQSKPQALSRGSFEFEYISFMVIAVTGLGIIGGFSIMAFSSMIGPMKFE